MSSEGYEALAHSAGFWTAEGSGQIEVSGPDANAWLNRVVTADLSRLIPGHFADSLLLRDDASILARVAVYRFAERLMLLVDASQRETVWQHLVERKHGNVRLRDLSADMVRIAVSGPLSARQLAPLLAPMPTEPCQVVTGRIGDVELFAARAAVRGPDGIDLQTRARDGRALEHALQRAGIHRVGASDWRLHQLEWAIAVVGSDVDPDDTPIEAGLSHLVAEGKGAPFPGEVALAARRRAGAIKRLIAFRVRNDELPTEGARVTVAGLTVDRVRALARSPRFGVIGTTAIPTTADAPDTPLTLTSGPKHWMAAVARWPFATRNAT